MYPAEKNTAEKLAETREVKTSKSRVNATIQRVRSQIGNSRLEVSLTSSANNRRSGGAISRKAAAPPQED